MVKPIPAGYHAVTPALIVKDPAKAIDFYKKIFGAKEVMRLNMPDGTIAHAEVDFGGSRLMVSPESKEWGTVSPQTLGGSPVTIHLYVADVDDVVRRAAAAGAKVLMPVADQFYGDRSGRLQDPFGHLWTISTHKEDVSEQEMKTRMADWTKKQSSA
jgi:PhnB protein